MSGYVKMSRGWLDDEMFQEAPYDERAAWGWMICEARYEDCKVSVNGRPVPVSRGQFYSSIRFMSEKFKWSKDRVTRFLKRLETWGAISTDTRTGQYLITICNYSKYQDGKDTPKDSVKDDTKDGGKDTPKDKQEEIQEIQEKDITPSKNSGKGKGKPASVAKPDDVNEQVWSDFLTHRKELRAPVTETALQGIRREAQKAGWSMNSALQECCTRAWRGFNAGWVDGKPDPHAAASQARPAPSLVVPEWQKPLLKHISENDVRMWFRDVRKDGAVLIFPSRVTMDWVKQMLNVQVVKALGEVEFTVGKVK